MMVMVVASTHLKTRFGRLSFVSSVLRFVQFGRGFLRKPSGGFDFEESMAALGDWVSSYRGVFSRSWGYAVVEVGV